MKNVYCFIVLFFVFSACKKEDKYTDVAIFGHAGDGLDIDTAPYQENTLEAIEYALSYPEVSGVEIDIQWSKEGTAWIFHDEDLSTQTNESGCVRSLTDEQLSTARYNGVQNLQLPKLNEAATYFSGKKVILDIKKPYQCGEVLTTSEFENSLLEFNSLLTNTEVYVVLQDLSDLSFIQGLGWKVILNATSISDYMNTMNWENTAGCSIRNADITAEEVAQLKGLGKEVIIFDARSPKTIRKALKKQPTVFLADDIKATLIEKIR